MNDSVELTSAKAHALGWVLNLVARRGTIDLKRFPDHVLATIEWDFEHGKPTAAARIIGPVLYRHHLGIDQESRLIEVPQMIHEAIQSLCIACAMEQLRRRGMLDDWELPDVFNWHAQGYFTVSYELSARLKQIHRSDD